MRNNIAVSFQYISYWLGGRGAVGLNNLMEDAATAEISRTQIWQWIYHGARLEDGRTINRELVVSMLEEEMEAIRETAGEQTWEAGRPDETREVFEAVALADELPDSLTLVADEYLDHAR